VAGETGAGHGTPRLSISKFQGQAVSHCQPVQRGHDPAALHPDQAGPGERRDRKGNAKIISQCIDYSWTYWDGFGHIPVFFCPGFKEIRASEALPRVDTWSAGYECGIGSLMAAVMGQNNIGELVYSSHLGWAFMMHGSHRIWSQRLGRYPAGVGVGKHAKMLRKAGSR